jgi:hypothetical protein
MLTNGFRTFGRRHRRPPRTPEEKASLLAERAELLERAKQIDAKQRTLAEEMGALRRQLAHLRVVMWPRIEPKDIVQGFRHTRVNGPAPIPPVARNAHQVRGRALRVAALAVLARHQRPMTLTEIHRELHLQGYAIESRMPVQRLADALAYEVRKGRAARVDRGVYRLGLLNPADRRNIDRARKAS